MAESEAKKRGCLRTGCLGCGALLLLSVLALVVFAVGGRFFAPEVNPSIRSLAPELPPPPTDAASAEAREPAAAVPSPPLAAPRGLLVLDLEEGSFELVPAPAGSGLRVEADYDAGGYELLEVKERSDDGRWTYRVVLRNTLGLFSLFRGRVENRVVVHVPAGLPLDLDANLRRGDSRLELGTLDLREVRLDLRQGAHSVRFSRPTSAPVAALSIQGRTGALVVSKLGNASPAQASVDMRMGALELDLSGPWATGGDLLVHQRMGGANVTAPLDVPLVVDRTHADAGEVTVSLPAGRDAGEAALARPVRLTGTCALGGLAITQR